MSSTTVLVSGANRGLGKGIVERFLARDEHTVVAAVRDPSHLTSKALADLPTGKHSRLVVVKIDSTVETDALKAADSLRAQGIDRLDLVIANAGVAMAYPKVSELRVTDLQAHLGPNVFGVVWLYQATLPLLRASDSPKWVTMGSTAGNLSGQLPIPNSAYGPSKAAVHWLTIRIDAEEESLTAFVIHPGFVQTDMGNLGARTVLGMEKASIGVDESCDGVVKVIDTATKESHGGRFWDFEGKSLTW
ncbi:hypothetical protein KVR01_009171 [Diaporthe batatas]|uniref:uncharacterized protein n=1 Tax=Diaporthe batatas TaxID=748121 RepID=UPI001D04E205|nr:uncharacterized protein KVR01_009171 [Diaporthe batatas]KAG8160907.1 hypothetical protein KVR01_009171 [Diaporthe batatas]